MASSMKTIKKSQLSRSLFNSGNGRSMPAIAKQLKVSIARVREYLERNDHRLSCPTCGGYGINKQRSTGIKKAICL